MTTREKLESKLEKRREWAVSRQQKAEAASNRASRISERFAFGQPILIGHHSQRGAENDQKRMHDAMSASVQNADMAEHHVSKAEGLSQMLDKSIFSDDEDAVERLEERIAKLEREQKQCVAINKICRNKKTTEEEKIAILKEQFQKLNDETINGLLHPKYSFEKPGFPSYVLTNRNGNLNRLRKRLEQVKQRKQQEEEAANAENGCIVKKYGNDYCDVVFAEKPDRDIINALKANGFRWSSGRWCGWEKDIPADVLDIATVMDVKVG